MKPEIVQFEQATIRKIFYRGEWWYSVINVLGAITGSSNPRRYWSDLKSRLAKEGFQTYANCVQLKLQAPDGKMRATICR